MRTRVKPVNLWPPAGFFWLHHKREVDDVPFGGVVAADSRLGAQVAGHVTRCSATPATRDGCPHLSAAPVEGAPTGLIVQPERRCVLTILVGLHVKLALTGELKAVGTFAENQDLGKEAIASESDLASWCFLQERRRRGPLPRGRPTHSRTLGRAPVRPPAPRAPLLPPPRPTRRSRRPRHAFLAGFRWVQHRRLCTHRG